MTDHAVSRQTAKTVTEAILDAIKPVLEAHGLVADAPSTTYGPEYTLKIKAHVAAVNENGLDLGTTEAQAYTALAGFYGLPENGLGRSFRNAGQTFTVVGLRTKARKRPVLVQGDDNKQYVFPVETVVALLNREAAV